VVAATASEALQLVACNALVNLVLRVLINIMLYITLAATDGAVIMAADEESLELLEAVADDLVRVQLSQGVLVNLICFSSIDLGQTLNSSLQEHMKLRKLLIFLEDGDDS